MEPILGGRLFKTASQRDLIGNSQNMISTIMSPQRYSAIAANHLARVQGYHCRAHAPYGEEYEIAYPRQEAVIALALTRDQVVADAILTELRHPNSVVVWGTMSDDSIRAAFSQAVVDENAVGQRALAAIANERGIDTTL